VADEPTTALDATIQAQILELLRSLQRELGMAVLLITHNLGLVADIASLVYVMYAGRIVESGPVACVLRDPRHPYSRGLLDAVPRLEGKGKRMRGIEGTVPHPARLPPGCKFSPRCPRARDVCRRDEPQIAPAGENRTVRCYFPHTGAGS
jgi:oligopeptide/dipeptide ABC transporter ATP-binding protein